MIKMREKHTYGRGWRRIALPASLVLNLFLVALVGGHLLQRGVHEVRPGMPLLARGLANAEASLSPPDAAAFDAVIRRDKPQYIEAAKQLEDARQVLERQIVAEPFDREAARQAFAAWHASWNIFIDQVGDPLIDALAQVSPEGRQKLVALRRQAQVGPHDP